MKKTIFLIITLVFIFTACDNQISTSESESSGSTTSTSGNGANTGKTSGTSTSSSGTTTTASSGTSETFTVTDSANIFEVSSSTASVTLEGLTSGQTIYLTKTNPTDTAISSSYTRYITGGTGISLSSGDTSSTTSSSGSSSGTSSSGGKTGPRHCVSLSLNQNLPQIEESYSRSLSSSITKVTPTVYTESDVGTATRSIYIDQDEDISTFAAETATLRALGEYCYVWVVSDNWTSSSASGEKINSEIAEKIASNFDSMYLKIRNVFGEESNYLSSNTSLSSQIAMSDYSETGEIVNIVIYDIGKDYSNGTNSGSVVGYFYAKDYFYLSNPSSVYKYSNKGKYFYVDAYYAVAYTSTVYSTLAHEFQHMIDFGVKSMENGLQTGTAYNEMKSMLCEDIMYSTLCELDSDFSEDDSPVSRLPLFNRHYYDVGLEYKESSPEVYYSYSNNYAFGAWLLRNNGGISLLHEIATNAYTDEKAITKALSSTGSEAASMEELLKNYTAACVLSSDDYGFKAGPSSSELNLNGYSYSLEQIDLWNLASALPETYSECKNSTTYYKFDGPLLYGYSSQVTLRPYGITLQKAGTATDSTVTLNFNTSGISTSQKVYIIVE
ncbi:MAG: hypothetical protein II821_00710 [Treponema sp.]|nr:hypothetical protein [Treponema sp.]